MKSWKESKDYIVNTERFAELAMTGSRYDALILIRSAIMMQTYQSEESDIVEFSDSDILEEIDKIRVADPPFRGEQLTLF